jgi:signal transduction histidine kinase
LLVAAERDSYKQALIRAQRLETIGQMTSGITHELNNVCTAISCSAELYAGGLDEIPDEIAVILDSTDRVHSLSRQLFALGRNDASVASALEVDHGVENAVRLLSRVLGSRIQLRLDLGAPHAMVRMDRHQLDQVLLNLAINARDAMPRGGKIVIRTRASEGTVAIEVEDSGLGVTEEMRERIFEPFMTTKAADQGTGLGLWVCRMIARDAGGDLTVHGSGGATFRLEIPTIARVDASDGRVAVPMAGGDDAISKLVIRASARPQPRLAQGSGKLEIVRGPSASPRARDPRPSTEPPPSPEGQSVAGRRVKAG